jgi:hypothetical protein
MIQQQRLDHNVIQGSEVRKLSIDNRATRIRLRDCWTP